MGFLGNAGLGSRYLHNGKKVYQLLDWGNGRKLESFNDYIMDRPCPAAVGHTKSDPPFWRRADARFDITKNHQGRWSFKHQPPNDWNYCCWFGKLRLAPSPFGHLGVFPEQACVWDWLRRVKKTVTGLKLLNLFAYTGGSTLAAAKIGAEVVHVDSAKNIVKRGRENAALSNLHDKPIRWIVDDVLKFVLRESRRENRYDGFILDPPTYGHGVGKSIWKIEQDLPKLVKLLRGICRDCHLIAFTCHSPGFDAGRVRQQFVADFDELKDNSKTRCDSGTLDLISADNRRLSSGIYVCWCRR